MKNVIGTVIVSAIVSAGVLFAYDWFIVQPRVRQAGTGLEMLDKIMAPQNRVADGLVRLIEKAEREFGQASDEARLNSLTSSLQTVRSQLELYKVQHNDHYPSLARFKEQMTTTTGIDGGNGTDFGPYLHAIPANPFTSTDTIGAGDYGSSAWHYNETTGEFRANDSSEHGKY